MNMECIHLFIEGQVQNVCYRVSAQEAAKNLSLTGWIKNLQDGRVELVAEGLRENLNKLIAWCHQGPPSAKVTHIEVCRTTDVPIRSDSFIIRYN